MTDPKATLQAIVTKVVNTMTPGSNIPEIKPTQVLKPMTQAELAKYIEKINKANS